MTGQLDSLVMIIHQKLVISSRSYKSKYTKYKYISIIARVFAQTSTAGKNLIAETPQNWIVLYVPFPVFDQPALELYL